MSISPDSKRTAAQQHTTFNRDHISFRGRLLEPGSADFDTARKIHNGLIDKRPAFIAQCASNNDVVTAIDMAIKLGLEISIRGGGHNVGGRAVTDGGLMTCKSTGPPGPSWSIIDSEVFPKPTELYPLPPS